MGNYITTSDIDNWPDGMSEENKQEIIDGVEHMVERITKDYFYAKEFDMKLNGNNRNRIYLPIRQKILSVTAVYVNEIELSSTEWNYDENSVFASNNSIESSIKGSILFPKGYNNIRVIGTLGWSHCPYSIKKACIILVKYENDNTLYDTYRFKSERLGEYSYTKDGKSYTGITEVDEYLNKYINKYPNILTY